jgi:hypothetical protein
VERSHELLLVEIEDERRIEAAPVVLREEAVAAAPGATNTARSPSSTARTKRSRYPLFTEHCGR